jgi:glutamyl-tRNA synthetase
MKKLEDYAKDDIARMPQEHFNREILAWTSLHDPTLHSAMMADPEYTTAVLAIERDGEKPRKDVAKWSDAPEQFGYFYDDIFELHVLPAAKKYFPEMFSESVTASVEVYFKNYAHNVDKDTWFAQLKQSAVEAGYTPDRKELKEHPDKYKGGIADFAGLLRVRLTGKTRTPDLYTIMHIMGESRVRSRLS